MKEFITAFVAAQKEMKSAIKETPNSFTGKKYADIASVDKACKEALNKHGIGILQPIQFENNADIVWTQLLHISGEAMESKTRIINAKGDSQGFGAGVTYARRYALASICGLVVEDDDGESAKSEKDLFKINEKLLAEILHLKMELISCLLIQYGKDPSSEKTKTYLKMITKTKDALDKLTEAETDKVIADLHKRIDKQKGEKS